jgi:hypothetical protein
MPGEGSAFVSHRVHRDAGILRQAIEGQDDSALYAKLELVLFFVSKNRTNGSLFPANSAVSSAAGERQHQYCLEKEVGK